MLAGEYLSDIFMLLVCVCDPHVAYKGITYTREAQRVGCTDLARCQNTCPLSPALFLALLPWVASRIRVMP